MRTLARNWKIGDRPIRAVAHDSREVAAGALFCALKGERTDGHLHLKEAASKGAMAALVDQTYRGEAFGLELIKVRNVLDSMQDLARERLKVLSCQVVGITGSIGKTSCKTYLGGLLEGSFRLHVAPGNFNSQVGLPLTILNCPLDAEVMLLEMAMTEPGQIQRLVSIAPPHIAVLTWVTLVHAATVPGLKEIALAKAEILSNPATRLAILYKHLPYFECFDLVALCAKKTFALEESASYSLCFEGKGAKIWEGTPIPSPLLRPPFFGRHQYHNYLAAVAVAREFGVEWEQIQTRTLSLPLPQRRMERFEKNGVTYISDCYNACADSIKAALDSLPEPAKGGRRIAVLGEMRELGPFSEACHQDVGKHALDKVDLLLALGDGARVYCDLWDRAKRPALHFKDLEHLGADLEKNLRPGDVVLVKGSCGLEMWRLFDRL